MGKKRSSKAERRLWWRSLTKEKQSAYIVKQMHRKKKYRGPRPFVEVTPETKDKWLKRIKAKNPWDVVETCRLIVNVLQTPEIKWMHFKAKKDK